MSGAGFMSAALALSAAGTVMMMRMMRHRRRNQDEVVMGVLGPSLASLHMLIVAFALVSGWQSLTDADGAASEEAKKAVELYWSARSVPDPVGRSVQADLRAYAQTAVKQEWPAMRQGKIGDTSLLLLDRARLRLLRLRTHDMSIEQRRLDTLDRLRDLSVLRDRRAGLAVTRLPTPLLVGVLVTSLLMIIFPLLMGIEARPGNVAWAVLTSGLLTVVIIVVFQFTRPYAGAPGIQPEALTKAQQQFDRIDTYPPSRLPARKK